MLLSYKIFILRAVLGTVLSHLLQIGHFSSQIKSSLVPNRAGLGPRNQSLKINTSALVYNFFCCKTLLLFMETNIVATRTHASPVNKH